MKFNDTAVGASSNVTAPIVQSELARLVRRPLLSILIGVLASEGDVYIYGALTINGNEANNVYTKLKLIHYVLLVMVVVVHFSRLSVCMGRIRHFFEPRRPVYKEWRSVSCEDQE